MSDPMDLNEPMPEADKIERLTARGLLHDEQNVVGAQDEIKRLAQLSQLEFEQHRDQAAKELGVRVSALDRMVRAEQRASNACH